MAVFDIAFYSASLHRQTQMTAIIPADFPDIPGMPKPLRTGRFPSLYLLHGFMGAHADWIRGTRIEQLALAHGVAVFCPSGENSFYLDDMKRDAYYGRLIGEELISFTRMMFPVSQSREDTYIGGLSMGGYGAIRNGLKYNETFSRIIALSSALITDNVAKGIEQEDNPLISASYFLHTFGEPEKIKGGDADPEALAKRLIESGAIRPKIYMACGTEDPLLDVNRNLHKSLIEMGYEHVYIESPGIHSWDFWDNYIEKALIWIREGN
jgi:S-formylglutathione hydrolase FrmB